MKALFDAIYGKFTAVTDEEHNDFYNDLSGRLYFGQAPNSATWPFAVFTLVSNVVEGTFTHDYENCLIQFGIYSTDESVVNVETYFEHCKALYDWCTLSITDYSHVYMRRESTRLFKDDVPAWNRIIEYRCWFEKTR